jgi:hypothetical protein
MVNIAGLPYGFLYSNDRVLFNYLYQKQTTDFEELHIHKRQ